MAYLALIISGLAFGSFVHALVWRVHKQSERPSKAHRQKYSILYGRSMCGQCKHTLAWYDLIPVLSWLWLRGKCRYCHKPIEDNPLIEVGLTAVFIISYAYWPAELQGGEWIVFSLWLASCVGLAALLVYDLKWMLLPNKIVYPLFGIAGVSVLLRGTVLHASGEIVSSLLGALVGGGIFYLLFQISGGKWIGGGDVRLGALLGLLVGDATAALLVIFLASALGSIVAVPLLIMRRTSAKSRLPFGPFLIMAGVMVVLFGASMIDWYKRTFLLV